MKDISRFLSRDSEIQVRNDKIIFRDLEFSVFINRNEGTQTAQVKLVPNSYKFDSKNYTAKSISEIISNPIEFTLRIEDNLILSDMDFQEVRKQIHQTYSYIRSIFEKALVLLQRIKEFPDEKVQNAARILLTTKHE